MPRPSRRTSGRWRRRHAHEHDRNPDAGAQILANGRRRRKLGLTSRETMNRGCNGDRNGGSNRGRNEDMNGGSNGEQPPLRTSRSRTHPRLPRRPYNHANTRRHAKAGNRPGPRYRANVAQNTRDRAAPRSAVLRCRLRRGGMAWRSGAINRSCNLYVHSFLPSRCAPYYYNVVPASPHVSAMSACALLNCHVLLTVSPVLLHYIGNVNCARCFCYFHRFALR